MQAPNRSHYADPPDPDPRPAAVEVEKDPYTGPVNDLGHGGRVSFDPDRILDRLGHLEDGKRSREFGSSSSMIT